MKCSVCQKPECTQPASLCERDQNHILISSLKQEVKDAGVKASQDTLKNLAKHFDNRGGWISAAVMKRMLLLCVNGMAPDEARVEAIKLEHG